jgi:hypothetical protein
VKRRRSDVAWLKSAYMVAFATWGYMYAFAPKLKIVQRQLEQCDEAIIYALQADECCGVAQITRAFLRS